MADMIGATIGIKPMTKGDASAKVVKSDEEWRAQLTPAQYSVARGHGTERAFTGPWWDNKAAGTYHLRVLRRAALCRRDQI